MANQKYFLENEIEDQLLLYAIRCTAEDFQLAFYLNKKLGIYLKKRPKDLDLLDKKTLLSFSIFEYINIHTEEEFFLVLNKCKLQFQKTMSAGSLFENDATEKIHYLFPEFKNADYILKINAGDTSNYKETIFKQILSIPIISACFEIEKATVKSKNNLNFDPCPIEKRLKL